MSVKPDLAKLVGKWKGSSRLHTPWRPEKMHDSASNAAVELRVNGQFLAVEYVWEHEGKKQEGVMILGCDETSDAVQAVWTDSWHMSHKFMVCDGTIDESGNVNMKGYYQVPGHPDWGWRTEILPGADSFQIKMYNASPEGEEDIAVESEYSRG
jgi:hypothetical protein